MGQTTVLGERRTSVDDIYDTLHEQIATMQLKPGDRLSEAEVAAQRCSAHRHFRVHQHLAGSAE